ncbi:MAG: adenylosuccinate synthase [Victivallales bacterium]|nr:adenylosuccinate synthase [Victivallales bacterium]MBR6074003.1 adenylosuccinate synthase [Victivallales bacterium]
MPSVVVVGTQWGDEGKGKIVDYLASQADVVARYQGGSNAGHTVVANGHEFKLHLLPSGILYPGCTCIIGNDVVVDPKELLDELDDMASKNQKVSTLWISNRAHVVMPYHKRFDVLEEKFKGNTKVGTTGRGIGPCYADAADRIGIRVVSWMDKEAFAAELKSVLEYKNRIMTKVFGEEPFDFQAIYDEYCGYADRLRPYVCDTCALMHEILEADKKILFEGAQAAMLDLSHGTYPFVTSSHPTAGAVCVGLGIGPKHINKIVGVVKAYATRVGEGPFPTEQLNENGVKLREIAHEYGATTGRPRRTGWLDMCVVKYAAQINGLDCIALTRLDILDTFPEIKICTGYRHNGRLLNEFPASLKVLGEVEPVYETLPGWNTDTSGIREYGQLPPNCRRYVERIGELAKTRIGIVSVGPDRDQTIVLEPMF